jgi:hypothetical protein
VALYPVYVSLAFTFMSDVPFVSLSSVALFFYVSAFVRNRPERLWVGGGVALLASLIRPLGLVLPVIRQNPIHRPRNGQSSPSMPRRAMPPRT